MKVLITEPLSEEGTQFLEGQSDLEVCYRSGPTHQELIGAIKNADALIVRSRTQVTGDVIDAAERLRVIGRAGAGVDNIDLDTATRKGVVVMNTPGGNSISVAEHTLALMLALARRIPTADASLRSNRWDKGDLVGLELHDKNLGILGLGKIGSIVARQALAFQMKIWAYDPFVSEEYVSDLGVNLASLEKVLKQADFVTLHLPLNDSTRYVIRKQTLRLMKKGSLLINTARGALIRDQELADALEASHLAGAALDVFSGEPHIHPRLLNSDKTIVTPHIAASTVEAQAKVGLDIARQVTAFLKKQVILNAVNFPSMSHKELARILPYLRLGEGLGAFAGQISRIRISEIGIRYYGELTRLDYKPITNYILKSILRPVLSEQINEVNARNYARDRGIAILETVSSRERSYSNLISLQLRSRTQTEWIEGAILHHGNFRLVSIDGIPLEIQLETNMLFIRNQDTPGVIGQVGTILGRAGVNIASFVLGRDESRPYAVGVVNTDTPLADQVIEEIRAVPAVQFAQLVRW